MPPAVRRVALSLKPPSTMHQAASRTNRFERISVFDDRKSSPHPEKLARTKSNAARSGAPEEGNSSLRMFRMATAERPSQTIVTNFTAVTLSLPNSLKISA